MSQQSSDGIIDTWCDETGCESHAPEARVKGKAKHIKYTNMLYSLGWTSRRRKQSEKDWIVNPWRHRCPNCSRTDNKGRLR